MLPMFDQRIIPTYTMLHYVLFVTDQIGASLHGRGVFAVYEWYGNTR